jgi:hypothetical protein
LSTNPNAIHILEENIDHIHWDKLSGNPSAIHLLEQNQEKIDWFCLSKNPSAIEWLKNNPEKVDYIGLCSNPSAIGLYDYDAMKQATSIFYEELMQKCFHPRRLLYYLENYDYDIGEDFV